DRGRPRRAWAKEKGFPRIKLARTPGTFDNRLLPMAARGDGAGATRETDLGATLGARATRAAPTRCGPGRGRRMGDAGLGLASPTCPTGVRIQRKARCCITLEFHRRRTAIPTCPM